MELETVEGARLVDELVVVDGKSFRKCTFIDCGFYYRNGIFAFDRDCVIIGKPYIDLPKKQVNAAGVFFLGIKVSEMARRWELEGTAAYGGQPRVHSTEE